MNTDEHRQFFEKERPVTMAALQGPFTIHLCSSVLICGFIRLFG